VSFALVASNAGGANSSAFPVLFWMGQGSTFDPTVNPWSVARRVTALKQNKSARIKLSCRFTGDQTGTFIYATDTNNNVLASTAIPDPQ
jgi:hypothetical protein